MPLPGGVRGGAASPSEPVFSSRWDIESGVVVGIVVSADVLREPRRCRFRAEVASSSKGLSLVEQGSAEEAARSRDSSSGSWSIWQRQAQAKEAGMIWKIAVLPQQKADKL